MQIIMNNLNKNAEGDKEEEANEKWNLRVIQNAY